MVPGFGLGRQDRDLGGIPCQAGVIKARSGDIAVGEALFLPPASSRSDHHDLLIADTIGCLQAVDPGVAEMRGENLTTFVQAVAGDNEYEYATGFQPAVGVAQKCLLGATTVSRPQGPIVGGLY